MSKQVLANEYKFSKMSISFSKGQAKSRKLWRQIQSVREKMVRCVLKHDSLIKIIIEGRKSRRSYREVGNCHKIGTNGNPH